MEDEIKDIETIVDAAEFSAEIDGNYAEDDVDGVGFISVGYYGEAGSINLYVEDYFGADFNRVFEN